MEIVTNASSHACDFILMLQLKTFYLENTSELFSVTSLSIFFCLNLLILILRSFCQAEEIIVNHFFREYRKAVVLIRGVKVGGFGAKDYQTVFSPLRQKFEKLAKYCTLFDTLMDNVTHMLHYCQLICHHGVITIILKFIVLCCYQIIKKLSQTL